MNITTVGIDLAKMCFRCTVLMDAAKRPAQAAETRLPGAARTDTLPYARIGRMAGREYWPPIS